MDYRTYTIYSVIGGILWGAGVTSLGYALGGVDFVRDHIELILLAIVGISVVPIGVELLRSRGRRRDTRYDEPRSARGSSTRRLTGSAEVDRRRGTDRLVLDLEVLLLVEAEAARHEFDGNDSTRVFSARTLAL